MVDFCVSCASCRQDASKICELCYCAELCLFSFYDRIHERALITPLEHGFSFVSVQYQSQVPVHTAQALQRLLSSGVCAASMQSSAYCSSVMRCSEVSVGCCSRLNDKFNKLIFLRVINNKSFIQHYHFLSLIILPILQQFRAQIRIARTHLIVARLHQLSQYVNGNIFTRHRQVSNAAAMLLFLCIIALLPVCLNLIRKTVHMLRNLFNQHNMHVFIFLVLKLSYSNKEKVQMNHSKKMKHSLIIDSSKQKVFYFLTKINI